MLLQTTEQAELLSKTVPLKGKVKLEMVEMLSWWRCALWHVNMLNDVLHWPLDNRKPSLIADGVVVGNCLLALEKSSAASEEVLALVRATRQSEDFARLDGFVRRCRSKTK